MLWFYFLPVVVVKPIARHCRRRRRPFFYHCRPGRRPTARSRSEYNNIDNSPNVSRENDSSVVTRRRDPHGRRTIESITIFLLAIIWRSGKWTKENVRLDRANTTPVHGLGKHLLPRTASRRCSVHSVLVWTVLRV